MNKKIKKRKIAITSSVSGGGGGTIKRKTPVESKKVKDTTRIDYAKANKIGIRNLPKNIESSIGELSVQMSKYRPEGVTEKQWERLFWQIRKANEKTAKLKDDKKAVLVYNYSEKGTNIATKSDFERIKKSVTMYLRKDFNEKISAELMDRLTDNIYKAQGIENEHKDMLVALFYDMDLALVKQFFDINKDINYILYDSDDSGRLGDLIDNDFGAIVQALGDIKNNLNYTIKVDTKTQNNIDRLIDTV